MPVISIGNLSVGGSGKTPMVIEFCDIMKTLGYAPCVVGRGYKRKGRGIQLVSDGENILTNATTGGDEMVLIAKNAKVPVIAGDSKSKVVRAIDAGEFPISPNCIIVDDGFQHRQLYRNLDIVLVDKNTLKRPYLLPKGRLREPFSSLKRADAIILTKGATQAELNAIYPTEKPVFTATYGLSEPYSLFQNMSVDATDVVAVTGIANPSVFVDMLRDTGVNVVDTMAYSDHHSYAEQDIAKIIARRSVIATTEKDAVKLEAFSDVFISNNINVLVYPLSVSISSGMAELLELIMGKCEKPPPKDGN